ncbi:DNA polymerase II [Motiliproteus coralliicola]|uniref:DNA polymerase n=1 Tax=Motiliproteus coralliicola TaxID=2283196 RepID=A0A369WXV3_9GAMM|nr:DNA polymerase II [Motiliproteus coralliicola]
MTHAGKNGLNPPEKRSGFVLTQQARQGRQGLDFQYWLSTDQGPVRWLVRDQEAVFFTLAEERQQVQELLRSLFSGNAAANCWRLQPLQLTDPQGRSVDGLYLNQLEALYRAREQLQRFGVTLIEDDIRPAERYLMERFICGGLQINAGQWQSAGAGSRWQQLEQASIAPCDYRPRLRVLSFDIETSMRGQELYSIGLYGVLANGRDRQTGPDKVELARVLMRGAEGSSGDEAQEPLSIHYFPSEKALLQAFMDQVREFDPDMLIGWNLIDFDLRFLRAKAEQLGLSLNLGRGGGALKWHERETGWARVSLPGRVVVDGIDCLKGATFQFESYSLEAVSQQLLGRGKKIDHVDQRGNEITRLFRHDKLALARYNLEDCRLVWQIFAKAKLLDYLIERSCLTGLMLDRVGGSAAAFDHLYLPRLHRAGRTAPPYASGEAGMSSPGGYVMDSRPGLYQDVLVLDFKSLYPSLIRSFLIDPHGLYDGLEQDAEHCVEGFNGARFSRRHPILPGLIATLWQARDQAKAEQNEPLSRAIKIIMNSFYGVLGSDQCRFFDHRLSGSITLRGHQVLMQSRDFIEGLSDDKSSYTVIYGDTDSLFVWAQQPPASVESIDPVLLGKQLVVRLNDWWRQRLQAEHGVESWLEIEFETHFQRFLMPTIRGSERGSKKRYAGMTVDQHGEPTLVFKGLESVRSDWTPLARRFQQQLYRRVFLNQPYRHWLKQQVEALLAGQCDDELVYRKRLRRPLQEYVKSQPPHVQAARIEEQQRQQRGELPKYHRSGSVSYLITVQGAQPAEYCTASIDYQHYLEKQLKPVAEAILPLVGDSFEQLVEPQQSLF